MLETLSFYVLNQKMQKLCKFLLIVRVTNTIGETSSEISSRYCHDTLGETGCINTFSSRRPSRTKDTNWDEDGEEGK